MLTGDTENVLAWICKGLSDESIKRVTTPGNSFSPTLK